MPETDQPTSYRPTAADTTPDDDPQPMNRPLNPVRMKQRG